MTANEVVVAGATFRYAHDGQPALRGLDLRAGGGKLVLLLGASGCGKTTATRLLNGLVPHFFEGGALDGSVDVCGMEPASVSVQRLAGAVGSVFQDPRSQFLRHRRVVRNRVLVREPRRSRARDAPTRGRSGRSVRRRAPDGPQHLRPVERREASGGGCVGAGDAPARGGDGRAVGEPRRGGHRSAAHHRRDAAAPRRDRGGVRASGSLSGRPCRRGAAAACRARGAAFRRGRIGASYARGIARAGLARVEPRRGARRAARGGPGACGP